MLGEQTIKVKVEGGVRCGGDNDFTSRRNSSMGNLTGAAWLQLQSPFVICREVRLQDTWFSLVMVSLLSGRVQASSHPVFKIDDRLQDGVSFAFLTLAPPPHPYLLNKSCKWIKIWFLLTEKLLPFPHWAIFPFVYLMSYRLRYLNSKLQEYFRITVSL